MPPVNNDVPVSWQLVDYQLNDPAMESEIKAGNIGQVTEVYTEGENLVVVTEKGKFTFARPELPEPDPNALTDPGATYSHLASYDVKTVTDIWNLMTLLHEISREQKG